MFWSRFLVNKKIAFQYIWDQLSADKDLYHTNKTHQIGLANLLAVSNESQELIGHRDTQLFHSEDEFLQFKIELHLTLPWGFSFLRILARDWWEKLEFYFSEIFILCPSLWQLVDKYEPWGFSNSYGPLFIIMILQDYMHIKANLAFSLKQNIFSWMWPRERKKLNYVFVLLSRSSM